MSSTLKPNPITIRNTELGKRLVILESQLTSVAQSQGCEETEGYKQFHHIWCNTYLQYATTAYDNGWNTGDDMDDFLDEFTQKVLKIQSTSF